MKRLLLSALLLLSLPTYADMSELSPFNLQWIKTLSQHPCNGATVPTELRHPPFQPWLDRAHWNQLRFRVDYLLDRRHVLQHYHAGITLSADHCGNFWSKIDTRDYDFFPGIVGTGGGGWYYGTGHLNTSTATRPFTDKRNVIAFTIQNVRIRQSMAVGPGDQRNYNYRQLNWDFRFVNPSTSQVFSLIVSMYNSRTDGNAAKCREIGALNDTQVGFNSSYFGTHRCGGRNKIRYFTPSPYSSYSFGNESSGARNFYGYITYKDMVDNLQALGVISRNNDNPDLSGWYLMGMEMGTEVRTRASNEPNDFLLFLTSGSGPSVALYRNLN